MEIVKTTLIVFLLTTALVVGYVVRRQAGSRNKSDTVELMLCIITGVFILGLFLTFFWIKHL